MANPNIPRVYNQNMERLAMLDKATRIGYKQIHNGLWMASFTLPADDPKNDYCQPFNYVEIFDGDKRVELFRIMKDGLVRSRKGHITYLCEFVITTLLNDIMFQFHQIGNLGVFTPEVIRYILSFQSVQNWRLGRCEFNHQFLYKWESENLLVALFDVPKPFVNEWHFTYDTTVYPWTVNLVRAESEIGCEIRYQKNMQGITREKDVKNLFTRIYPLGYGEGDNQLTIASVNNGIPFLQAETASKYGIISVPWVDRRFEDVNNMMATAKTMLAKHSVPFMTYAVESIDLFQRTGQEFDEFAEGKMVRVIDQQDGIDVDARIVELEKPDVTGADINITLANRDRNIAGSIADAQRRNRINETYAQGAETLMMIPIVDNAEPNFPLVFEFFIPAGMVNINEARLRVQLLNFRANSRAIRGGGGTTQTSTSGGGVETSTASGGATTQTTTQQQQETPTTSTTNSQTPTTTLQAQETRSTQNNVATTSGASSSATTSTGGGAETTSRSAGNQTTTWFTESGFIIAGAVGPTGTPPHSHNVSQHIHPHTHNVDIPPHHHLMPHDHTVPGHTHDFIIPAHSHQVTIPGHSHTVTIPAHGHSVTIPSHQHNVVIPAHSHNITMPDHIHEIEFGIFTGTRAVGISIRVDGNLVPIEGDLNNVNIIPFLRRDGGGRIVRNAWHTLEIVPDTLTRISASIFLNIFTNSRGGENL